jgi:hypothetical protein
MAIHVNHKRSCKFLHVKSMTYGDHLQEQVQIFTRAGANGFEITKGDANRL